MNIGSNLVTLRKNKNLTQEELAKLINVSPKTISSYETNRSLPNLEILISLTSALDTNIETILNLKKDNTEEIKQIYEKRTTKNTIIKTLIISLIFIIPLIFFTYTGYVSISYFAASISFNQLNINEIAKNTYNLFLSFTYEYFIYTLLMLINYLLYKKKCIKTLFILNIIISLILLIQIIEIIYYKSFYQFDFLIFIIIPLFGLGYAFKLLKTKKSKLT